MTSIMKDKEFKEEFPLSHALLNRGKFDLGLSHCWVVTTTPLTICNSPMLIARDLERALEKGLYENLISSCHSIEYKGILVKKMKKNG